MANLKHLLHLPEEVKKTDFVVRLTEGVARPQSILDLYAVTPDLRDAYDQALRQVKRALDDVQSNGAYIHGSFGSGKSHFMAILSLLLAGEGPVWKVAELQDILARHEWVKGKRLLRLHFHMVGAGTLEEKIFGEYVRFVGEVHPEAGVPPLFEDEELFQNAQALRQRMGDEAFFAALNEAAGEDGDDDGWGDVNDEPWDAARFDTIRRSHDTEERTSLFEALAETLFPAWKGMSHRYLDLDTGLSRLTTHAAGLGYEAVVLFLDELVLWLASRAADKTWLSMEVQKASKLVEAQAPRKIPVVSFVARQRDIIDMVGENLEGSENEVLRDSLKWWEGRFDRILLPNRNLPAIVEKRVVRPKDAGAKAELEKAFEKAHAGLGGHRDALLAEEDERAFRQVYPFSPALIEALVALSHYLQRDRTALKVLMEMLVDHLNDLELGQVVALGDLYDVLAGGEEPMDGAMRAHFHAAGRLYQHELLPVIRNQNGTDHKDKCRRMRDDHPLRLGCAGCPEQACRTDNRLVKTLLLAALVPKVSVFRNLTASRIAALNHGSVRAPIAGYEAAQTVQRIRAIAAEVGKLRVGEEGDPRVHMVLEGVDLGPILASARVHDNAGNRKHRLRLLFAEALDLDPSARSLNLHVDWRGTRRQGQLVFANVREADERALTVERGEDFRLIVDYPFDERGHTPAEDEARVAKLRDGGLVSPTVIWLPSFLGEKVQKDLGELAVIEAVLGDPRKYLDTLRPDDRSRAQMELESLASQKKERVRAVLLAAYGISSQGKDQLDGANLLDKHFHVLIPGLQMRPTVSAGLEDAVNESITQLFEQRYPRHPKFTRNVNKRRLLEALERYAQVCEADGRRLSISQKEREDYAVLDEAQLVELGDASVLFREHRVRELGNRLAQAGIKEPTVGQVRSLIDPDRTMGLSDELTDFFVLAWTTAEGREIVLGGRPVESPEPGKLAPDAVLIRPPLPEQGAFNLALDRAGALWGIAIGGKAVNPRNVRSLVKHLELERKAAVAAGAGRIADLLVSRRDLFEGEPHRLRTALRVTELLGCINHDDPVAVVHGIARLDLGGTSLAAMSRHLRDARQTGEALSRDLTFGVFESLRGLDHPRASGLLKDVRAALEADQLEIDLAPRLDALALEAQNLLRPPPPTPPAPQPTDSFEVVAENAGRGMDALTNDLERVGELLQAADGEVRLEWSWKVLERKKADLPTEEQD